MSRPVIGRDHWPRQRTARTLEEAFGHRGGLHASRQRYRIGLDAWIGAGVALGIAAMLFAAAL